MTNPILFNDSFLVEVKSILSPPTSEFFFFNCETCSLESSSDFRDFLNLKLTGFNESSALHRNWLRGDGHPVDFESFEWSKRNSVSSLDHASDKEKLHALRFRSKVEPKWWMQLQLQPKSLKILAFESMVRRYPEILKKSPAEMRIVGVPNEVVDIILEHKKWSLPPLISFDV